MFGLRLGALSCINHRLIGGCYGLESATVEGLTLLVLPHLVDLMLPLLVPLHVLLKDVSVFRRLFVFFL